MRKRVLALGLCAAMAIGTMTGCSASKGTGETQKETTAKGQDGAQTEAGKAEAKEDLEGSLVFAIWDNNLMDYIDENDMVGKFQEKYPKADIEVE
ncbi:MAG TPA: sugar ABC transporter substrate-binding protein, partial [Lachnoclostridium sp.]|nr:sugar ABC transporter substrate-binding protein [Lachnoclostridium sp.]